MSKDPAILQIELLFKPLRNVPADNFPGLSTLSTMLNKLVDESQGDYSIKVNQQLITKFATASVEMWHRSVHSFLISASLTKSSPLWSSVSGYYSSHYSVRAFAHLFGFFQLHTLSRKVELEMIGGSYYCNIKKRGKRGGEHNSYWRFVKGKSIFQKDTFFTINDEYRPISDGAHRNRANYADHLGNFPTFSPLDKDELIKRIRKIASIEYSDAPIPNSESYPDLDNVQVMAYHRLVRFRRFLDKVLGTSNRFWTGNRLPAWCSSYMNFQVVQPEYSTIYQNIL
jgi:hypothetical protein